MLRAAEIKAFVASQHGLPAKQLRLMNGEVVRKQPGRVDVAIVTELEAINQYINRLKR